MVVGCLVRVEEGHFEGWIGGLREDGGGKPELGWSGHVLPHCKRGIPLLVVGRRMACEVVDWCEVWLN